MQRSLLTLLTFVFLQSWFVLPAQVSLLPEQVVVEEVPIDSFQVIGYGRVKNLASTTRTYRWTRQVRLLSEGWEAAVCDTNLCYLPTVETATFELAPDLEANMDVYIYPNGLSGEAIVEVTVTDEADENITATATYYFNVSPNAVRQPVGRHIRVFPNPVRQRFQLSHHEQISRVAVYNLLGRQLQEFSYQPGGYYDIGYLPQGAYLVQIKGRNGRILVTRLLNKQ